MEEGGPNRPSGGPGAPRFRPAFSGTSVNTGRFKQRGHDRRGGGTSCHNEPSQELLGIS